MASVRAVRRSRNGSRTRRSTKIREAAEHFWPCRPKALPDDAAGGRIEIGVAADEGRVLAAHFDDAGSRVGAFRQGVGAVESHADLE